MKHQSITSLPPAPGDDRRNRMLEYSVMMTIRVLCLISLIWVRGWWILIPAAGAIFLPYFAVVVANVAKGRAGDPRRPDAIVPVGGGDARYDATASGDDDGADDTARSGFSRDGSAPHGSERQSPAAPGADPRR